MITSSNHFTPTEMCESNFSLAIKVELLLPILNFTNRARVRYFNASRWKVILYWLLFFKLQKIRTSNKFVNNLKIQLFMYWKLLCL
jgi:hypothetical protein